MTIVASIFLTYGSVASAVRIIRDGGIIAGDTDLQAFEEQFGYVDVYLINMSVIMVVRIVIFIFLIISIRSFFAARRKMQKESQVDKSEILRV